jgi:hypothetical protein
MLEQIANIAEILAAVGVVVSLVYVGRQLQQTNTMSRSTVRQSMSAQMNDFTMSIASSPELTRSIAKVHFEELVRDDATAVERIHIAYAYASFIGQIRHAYEQQKEGILSEKEAEELYGQGPALLNTPYLASLWPILRPGYPSDFVEWFEQRLPIPAGRQPAVGND